MRPNTPQVATYKSPHDIKQDKYSILGLPLSSSRAKNVNQTIPDSQSNSPQQQPKKKKKKQTLPKYIYNTSS